MPGDTQKDAGSRDRAAHEARRGKKQPTLADLSRTLPDEEEVSKLFELMENESDRGCALVAGSFVEAAVEMAVAARMVDDKKVIDEVFYRSDSPAGSFSAKIKLAQGLGMFGPQTAEKLRRIKDVRNAFAHALRPLDFSHPTIVRACEQLDPRRPMVAHPPKLSAARVRYIAMCRALFFHIYRKAQEEGGKIVKYDLP